MLLTLTNVKTVFSNAQVLLLPSGPVNITGRVILQGDVHTKNYRGRILQMQEAIITDETGSMRLVLWDSDIRKISSGCSYDIQIGLVRNFKDVNYLTFNSGTDVKQSDHTIKTPMSFLLLKINYPQQDAHHLASNS